MNVFSKYSLIYASILVFSSYSNSHANNVVVEDVNCGILNIGQTKNITIPIVNNENSPLIVEKMSVCCGNPMPTINMMNIQPGETAELTQAVRRTKPGVFKINPKVFLQKPDKRILSFHINGEAKQPISALIGWEGEQLEKVNYLKESIRLNQINYKGKDLTLRLFAEVKSFNLKNTISDVKSKLFSFDSTSLEYNKSNNAVSTCSQQLPGERNPHCQSDSMIATKPVPQLACKEINISKDYRDVSLNTLHLRLSPKTLLSIGELSDKIIVAFKDGSECHIPIVFRSVGDIYAERSSLPVGRIPFSGKVNKVFNILFSDGIRPWTQVKWKVEGILSEAITASPNNEKVTENTLSLIVEIDGNCLPSSEKGFLSSYIDFFENEREDRNIVRLYLYGYR